MTESEPDLAPASSPPSSGAVPTPTLLVSSLLPSAAPPPPPRVLLYVGALTDAFPLTLEKVRKDHGVIVFSDQMPADTVKFYEGRGGARLNTCAIILEELLSEGGSYGFLDGKETVFELNEVDGSYEAMLKDGCKFKYFFNTVNVSNPHLPTAVVTTLWLKGYMPPASVLDHLPSLSMVYSTDLCVGPLYWAARERIKHRNEGWTNVDWNVNTHTNDTFWDSDKEAFGVWLEPDEEPNVKSDAPSFRYWEDHGDDDGDDGDDNGDCDDDDDGEGDGDDEVA